MNKIRNDHLERQAFVYIRQSTMGQVQNHLESKRRQYALAERARALGWQQVQVIDEDQGRSGGGAHRPGFERLLAALCASILNRLGRRTGRGHTWNEGRVRAFRGTHDIAVYQEGERLDRGELTLEETAKLLKISTESVRRLIAQKVLVAQQACTGAPWVIQRAEVDRMVAGTNNSDPHTSSSDQISLDLQ